MKPFVFIFQQGNKTLTENEEQQRAKEVRAWALRQFSEGRNLDPRLMAPEYCRVSSNGENYQPFAGADSPSAAIVFFEANDLQDAVSLAKTHPGLRYGVSIEVRPWTAPARPAK